MFRKAHIIAASVGIVLAGSVTANMFLAPSNIDPSNKFCWSENTGWMNWRDADGANQGVLIGDDFLSGYVWAENIGWINTGEGSGPYANTSDADFGVNRLGNGDLDGLAWSENAGWLNFGWAASTANGDRARFDDGAGRFRGWVWGENIGWVNLDDSVHYVAAAPLAPPELAAEPAGGYMNRFVAVVVPVEAAGQETALRVELVTLNHPRFCCTDSTGTVCSATSCNVSPQCALVVGNPVCAHQSAAGAPDFSSLEGKFRYVNSFGGSLDCPDDGLPFNTSYKCATLGCEPEYRDWAAELATPGPNQPQVPGLIYITSDAVVPSSTLSISHIAASCGAAATANTCASASAPLAVGTARWGDITGAAFSPPDGKSDVLDIPAVVNKLKGIPTFFSEPRTWLKQRDPAPNTDAITVIDLSDVVDGGPQAKPYPASRTVDLCTHD